MFGSDAMMIRRSRESGPPDNEVWYYAPSQVTLYDSTDVQSHTFANGKGVLKFASAVHSIGQWLRGTAVTDVKMNETVERIGQRAFSGCTSLAMTSLSSGITSIGLNAFYGCSSLALTSLPSGITSIGTYAFYDCSSLALTSLPSGVTSIGNYAFYGCSSLALTSLPSGVTSIGTYAFYGCFKTGTHSITFLGTPASIASNAFNSNTKLTDIYVPWAEGEVANAPWGATNATIHYAPAPAQYYYTASGSNEAGVNGNYELQSGTHGTTSAVYTNGTYYIYYYSDYWIINTQTGVYGAFYRSGTIEGAYQQMTSFNTPPTVTAYA